MVFYLYFGLRMRKFEVKFINNCYFMHQAQMAYLEFIWGVTVLLFK